MDESEVYWELTGGLGNQIFQMWAAHWLENMTGRENQTRVVLSNYLKDKHRSIRAVDIVRNVRVCNGLEINKKDKLLSRVCQVSTYNRWRGRAQLAAGLASKVEVYERLSIGNSEYKLRLDDILWLKERTVCKEETGHTFFVRGFWQDASILEDCRAEFRERVDCLKEELPYRQYIAIHLRTGDYCYGDTARAYRSKTGGVRHIVESWCLLPKWTEGLPVILCCEDTVFAHEIATATMFKDREVCVSTAGEVGDWQILRNAVVLIGSNSTFSATAALLSTRYEMELYRAYLPGWYDGEKLTSECGWTRENKIMALL